jgi:hypothetical protein
MDASVPDLRLDAQGVCHLCHVQDRLARELAAARARAGGRELERLVAAIRAAGRGRAFDCVVPLSGGGDSSWTLVQAVRLGLRPVAYHFDNGWVSDEARHNIDVLTTKLGVPLRTLSYPWEDLRDTYLATLRASVPEVCLPCLVAVWSLAFRAAAAEGVRHVLHGSSPFTEGICPRSWSYVDGRFLESVAARFGTPGARRVVRDLDHLRPERVAWDLGVRRTRVVMMPTYLPWDDHAFKAELVREFGWRDGGKHADCLYHHVRDWIIWEKFGFDLRKLLLSALVRNGRLTRAAALAELAAQPPAEDAPATALVLERLGLTRAAFDELLAAPRRSHREFATYLPFVRALRPAIALAVRAGLLSRMVYDKYFEC